VGAYDDFPAPREMVPSGKMDELPDGAHRMMDLRGMLDLSVLTPPADLKTRRQKKQYLVDRVIHPLHQAGFSVRTIAKKTGQTRMAVQRSIERIRDRRAAEKAGLA
jgi:hypothetical protein